MARQPSVRGGRTEVWATRLSPAESAQYDALRKGLSRAEFLRWLLLQAGKK